MATRQGFARLSHGEQQKKEEDEDDDDERRKARRARKATRIDDRLADVFSNGYSDGCMHNGGPSHPSSNSQP